MVKTSAVGDNVGGGMAPRSRPASDQRRGRDISLPDLRPNGLTSITRSIPRPRSTTSRSARAVASGNFRPGRCDFGASDSPMTEEQFEGCPVPRCFTSQLSWGAVVATLQRGWRRPRAELHADAWPAYSSEPSRAGTIRSCGGPTREYLCRRQHRGVCTGATEAGLHFVWTDFLSKTSAAWRTEGRRWDGGEVAGGSGREGNEGVAASCGRLPTRSVTWNWSTRSRTRWPTARCAMRPAVFVKPDLKGVTAAAAAATMPERLPGVYYVSPRQGCYPISSFTWLLVPSRIQDAQKRGIIAAFLKWMLADGQRMAEPLGYAPLPKAVIEQEFKAIGQIL